MNTIWIDANGDRLTRDDVTYSAFWGGYPALVDYLRDLHGYEMAGYHWPANGFSMAEFRQWANALNEATFARLTGGTVEETPNLSAGQVYTLEQLVSRDSSQMIALGLTDELIAVLDALDFERAAEPHGARRAWDRANGHTLADVAAILGYIPA